MISQPFFLAVKSLSLSHLPSKNLPSKVMGPSRFLPLLLVISLSFPCGFGRSLTETVPPHHYSAKADTTKENSRKLRMMIAQVMDYGDPKANTDPKYADLLTPPPAPSSLSPSPS